VDTLQAFADIVNRADGEIDLTRAAAMIGLRAYPDLDVDGLARALDDMAVGVHDLAGLRRRLFADLGLTGESLAYYHPDNSFLHRVVERRRGIPITLSVLAIEVGRRAGVTLEGIGMPGHFLVRESASGLYMDAFHGGVLLDEQACELLFRAATGAGPEIPFGASLLPVVGRAQILGRMLNNLGLVHRVNADAPALEWTLRLRMALPEVTGQDIIELAEAVAAQGRARAAVRELEAWAEVSPDLAGPLKLTARGLLARLN
jgi:regulator of sirC expression with transglutaminase-like and TPR domain